MRIVDVAYRPHGADVFTEASMSTSLEHAMWFHAPFRGDEWLLCERTSPRLTGSRGLVTGRMWRRDGTHVVTLVQEALIRTADAPAGARRARL